MFPLKDENPSSILPYVNWLLILLSIVIFIWQLTGGSAHYESVVENYGLSPSRIMLGGAYYTFLTSMFLHGDLLHIGGNMLYLYIFGDNVEDMCGHASYLAFYLICGFFASVAYILTSWGSTVPAIGASGAISGVLGAYIILFPKARILTAVPLGFGIRLVRIPAYLAIGVWFIYQFLLAFIGTESGVAYWAHIGGFVVGLALAKAFAGRRHRHPMFARHWVS